MDPVYRPVVGLALTIMKVMRWKVSVTGAEHIPVDGPAVIATNHIGYLDFVFVGAGARERKRLVRFMAKQEVFDHKVSGPLMRGMKHIAVDRFGAPKDAIDAAVAALRGGELVGMFPESTISRSFVPRAGKTGAARMAMEAGAPLIPGAVWGTQRILTKGRPKNFERNIPISVHLGPPIDVAPGDDPTEVTERLMKAIGVLVDDASTSYPVTAASPDDWWIPAHLGGSAPTVEEADRLAAAEKAERAERRRRSAEGGTS